MTSRFRVVMFTSMAVALSIGAICVCGELGVRLFYAIRQGIPAPFINDRPLGWRIKPNSLLRRKGLRDACGTPTTVEFRTFRHGFCQWDEPSPRPRLFFIGDSFTQPGSVSNDSMYFARLARLLDADACAYGASGYGTLQEWMVLDAWIDSVMPDEVILQMSGNDIENNSYELETSSVVRRQADFRPYLRNGRIVYRHVRWNPVLALYAHSLFLAAVDSRIARLQFRLQGNAYVRRCRSPADSARRKLATESALRTTDTILSWFAERAGQTVRLSCFMVSHTTPELQRMLDMARSHGFEVLSGVADSVSAAQDRGTCVRAADGAHWNATGHRIAAQQLALQLEPRYRLGEGNTTNTVVRGETPAVEP